MPRRHDRLPGMSRPNVPQPDLSPQEALALLEWQIAMGADEAIGETARDWFPPAPAIQAAQALADPFPAHSVLEPPPTSPLPNSSLPGRDLGITGEGRVGASPRALETPKSASVALAPSAPTRVAPPGA